MLASHFDYIFYGVLVFCVVLLVLYWGAKREQKRATDQVNQHIAEYNQLVAKYELLLQSKQGVEERKIKAETQVEALTIRLNERDEKISHLSREFDEEQAKYQLINQQITALKEQYGKASAKAETLEKELVLSRSALLEKEQYAQQILQKYTALSQELTEIRTTLQQKEQHFAQLQQQAEQQKQALTVEFQNLANRILEEKSKGFEQTNQQAIQNLLQPFREQIEGFQKRVNQIHSETLQGNANLNTELKNLAELGLKMSNEANNLTSALKGNKKMAGNWGEIQLERSLQLAGLVKGDHYLTQQSFNNSEGKNLIPDFVVKLPDNKHLIIDSKVSLVAYESAVASQQEFEMIKHLKEHINAIKRHIIELSSKNYSQLLGIHSPDFVLMFIPIEPAFIEALKQDGELFNFGYSKNVILVSHTTLLPILRTVANLWRIERGNQEAQEISEKAGDIYNQVCVIAERLLKLGNTLSSATTHYNNVVTAVAGQQGLYGKVERFKTLSAKANKTMPTVEMLYNDADVQRLQIFPLVEKVGE